MLKLAAIAALCLDAHCRPIDGCILHATRCASNAAEISDADGSYDEFADCDVGARAVRRAFHLRTSTRQTRTAYTGHSCASESDVDAARATSIFFLTASEGGGGASCPNMTISQDEFNKAFGLPSNSTLTQEQAARKVRDALDAQEKGLADLRKLYDQALNSVPQGR